MMVIVGVLRQTGVFEYVAIWAAKRARGRPFLIMVMLVVLTAVASALLDNVTTVLLVAPVTLLVCEQIDAPPVPVPDRRGDGLQHRGHRHPHRRPAEHHHRLEVRASRSTTSWSTWARSSCCSSASSSSCAGCMFRSSFTYRPESVAALMALDEREAITDGRLLVKSRRGDGRRTRRLRRPLRAGCRAGARRPSRRRDAGGDLPARRRPTVWPTWSGRPWSSSWACS